MAVHQVLTLINRRRREPLAYTTVMTVMSRLEREGVLSREKQGRGYVYEPTVADAAGLAVRGVLRDFGDPAMARFVDEARGDPKMLRRLKRMLSD
jgi:predicted transcriptional regulator